MTVSLSGRLKIMSMMPTVLVFWAQNFLPDNDKRHTSLVVPTLLTTCPISVANYLTRLLNFGVGIHSATGE